jgi:4-aminobutyrate aminotransferase/(S)-3-amino-2-methylpropionate transaminase
MFAIEHSGVEPDLMTVAKSIAGGVPLSAVTGRAAIMDAPAPGGLGGTYAGSPLACAAGITVLDVIREERLEERAQTIGARLMQRLGSLQQRHACIGDVRGLGAMVAMELVKGRRADQPDAELAKALVQAAGRRGLVLLSCGIYSNVIRFLPPLTIEDGPLEEGLAILEASLDDVAPASRVRATA